jgi:hypothetical protein
MVEITPTEEVAAQPTVASAIPGRPVAPAGIDEDFREDSPLHVAATGRPQLVEFFAFW